MDGDEVAEEVEGSRLPPELSRGDALLRDAERWLAAELTGLRDARAGAAGRGVHAGAAWADGAEWRRDVAEVSARAPQSGRTCMMASGTRNMLATECSRPIATNAEMGNQMAIIFPPTSRACDARYAAYFVPKCTWGDDVTIRTPKRLAAVVRAALFPEEVERLVRGGNFEKAFDGLHGPFAARRSEFEDARPYEDRVVGRGGAARRRGGGGGGGGGEPSSARQRRRRA